MAMKYGDSASIRGVFYGTQKKHQVRIQVPTMLGSMERVLTITITTVTMAYRRTIYCWVCHFGLNLVESHKQWENNKPLAGTTTDVCTVLGTAIVL